MKINIRSRHVNLTTALQEEIRRRVRNALDRVERALRVVDVTIADINGPRGGADKKCLLRVRGRSLPTIVVESIGVDTLATVTRAAERAEQVAIHKIARRRLFAPLLAY